jgi:hypothetical protein
LHFTGSSLYTALPVGVSKISASTLYKPKLIIICMLFKRLPVFAIFDLNL